MLSATVESLADEVRATVREIEAEVSKFPNCEQATYLLDSDRVLRMSDFDGELRLAIVSGIPFKADEALEDCDAKLLIELRDVLPHFVEMFRTGEYLN